ncbi:MAG: PadR family transcriptional regulator [Anaerolineales bacterium]|nr:PadR family transcriptional regulator [Anaerolineales bacterium]
METDVRLPISETTFFILLSLSTSPMHGYAIMKEVSALSQGRVILSTGTLYGALKRLLDQGWIMRTDEIVPPQDQRDRKAYQLTRQGRRMLEAEADRLGNLVSLARLRLTEEQA